jgi:hypothetical protein
MRIRKGANLSYLINDGEKVIEVKSLREWCGDSLKLYNRVKGMASLYDVFRFKSPDVIITRLVNGTLPLTGARVKYGKMRWNICHCGNGYRMPYGKLVDHCEECMAGYDYEFYNKQVRRLTTAYRGLIPGIDKVVDANGKLTLGYVIDHIVPVFFGFRVGIPIHRIAQVDNLQIMAYDDNGIHGKMVMLPDEWRNHLTGMIWKYSYQGEQSIDLFGLCNKKGLDYVGVCSRVTKNQWPIIINGEELKSYPLKAPNKQDVDDAVEMSIRLKK